MGQINILDSETINVIAAGEVVERPSSIVKELAENAIDSHATAVSVMITDGGISSVRITDNGCGISKEDIPTAFLRHATSKIRQADDLRSVRTLGFRGEALSSIAAVSQVELLTKQKDDLTGIRYCIEGGQEKSSGEIGCPDGTTIIVRNLFYNTPVRKKFLKTSATEAGYVNDIMVNIALSNPCVAVKFMSNGKLLINTSGNGKQKDIIYQLFGRDIAADLIPIDCTQKAEDSELRITGFIAAPTIARGNRSYEHYYLNGRPIVDSTIRTAIEAAYHGKLMQNKYPFTVLSLTIPQNLFDVNVHPSKLEVRFSEQEQLSKFIYQSIFDALNNHKAIPIVSFSQQEKITPLVFPKDEVQKIPEPFETVRRMFIQEENQQTDISFIQEEKQKPDVSFVKNENQKPDVSFVQETFLTTEAQKQYRIIGQVFETYWLVEYEDKLYIIDQHAAHEKVLFEKMIKQIHNNMLSSQNISPSLVLTLSLREIDTVERYHNVLNQLGYEIEPFGGREYVISAVPACLPGTPSCEMLLEFIDMLTEEPFAMQSQILYDKVASMSCKAAVKGNHTLSELEAKSLINQLLELDDPFRCPHGRPVVVEMTKTELEKKFKRIIS